MNDVQKRVRRLGTATVIATVGVTLLGIFMQRIAEAIGELGELLESEAQAADTSSPSARDASRVDAGDV